MVTLKILIAAKRREKVLGLLGVSGGMLPWKILKIQLLIWAKIAFPALYYALSSQIFDNF